ncbi:MAG: hypothetical protein AB8G05_13305 [Oligoflexales bacterium]
MKRCLIIIASQQDEAAVAWHEMCLQIGRKSLFLTVESYNHGWTFQGSNSRCFIKSVDFGKIHLVDESICFYTRIPFNLPKNFFSLKVLNDFLSLISYDHGGYFFRGAVEANYNTKPLQFLLRGCFSYPFTLIGNVGLVKKKLRSDYITKSLSFTRSQVVELSSPLLKKCEKVILNTPSQVQEKIVGYEEKIHFYKKRNGDWIFFPVRIDSDSCDYRYSDPNFSSSSCVDGEGLASFASYIFEHLGCRFFDIDIIVKEEKNFFLEINLAPVPTFFESKLIQKNQFTQEVLMDWLS